MQFNRGSFQTITTNGNECYFFGAGPVRSIATPINFAPRRDFDALFKRLSLAVIAEQTKEPTQRV